MMEFYISADCESCGDVLLKGLCLTMIEHDGYPVIPYDIAAQETFVCGCGAEYLTGDFDLVVEGEV